MSRRRLDLSELSCSSLTLRESREGEGKGEDEGEDSVPRLSTFVSFSEGPYIARIPYISIRAFLLSILAASFLNGYGSLEARQPELATC